MKKLLLTAGGTLLALAAFAQGTVTFGNASTIAGWNPVMDRNVKWGPHAWIWNPAFVAGDNVSSNYAGVDLSSLRATLYYGVGVTELDHMIRASGTEGATFRPSTSTTAGSWFTKTARLDGVALGTTVNLIVVVWDSRLTLDPIAGLNMPGPKGASSVFQYTLPTSPTPAPVEFLMNGFTGMVLDFIPEPTSLALAGLGAAALLILRRRK